MTYDILYPKLTLGLGIIGKCYLDIMKDAKQCDQDFLGDLLHNELYLIFIILMHLKQIFIKYKHISH
jgi:hypothetical protein